MADRAITLLRTMMLIRAFEAALASRSDHGFQLFSSGEEAVAVGVCAAMRTGDILLTSGRSIGPALAKGIEPAPLMAELLGRVAGPNRGRAGRGHLADPTVGLLGAHAVVGGNLSIAAGVALAMQTEARPAAVVCVFGDGACGAGALHETLNIAAIWKLPLVLVCDNNGLAVATRRAEALAPERLSDLAAPFGVAAATVDGMDVNAVLSATQAFLDRARSGAGPAFLECLAERFMSHSTATRETRSVEEMVRVRARCPIDRLATDLVRQGKLDAPARAALEADVEAAVARAVAFAEVAPFPDLTEAIADVV